MDRRHLNQTEMVQLFFGALLGAWMSVVLAQPEVQLSVLQNVAFVVGLLPFPFAMGHIIGAEHLGDRTTPWVIIIYVMLGTLDIVFFGFSDWRFMANNLAVFLLILLLAGLGLSVILHYLVRRVS